MENRKQVEIMKGPKLDGSYRPMWFAIENGKKRRIGERSAHQMLNVKTAIEVPYRSVTAK